MSFLRITLKRSYAGQNHRQRRVVQSLGLRRISQQVVHMDSPTIRGMIYKVRHMVEVEEVDEMDPQGAVQKSPQGRPSTLDKGEPQS